MLSQSATPRLKTNERAILEGLPAAEKSLTTFSGSTGRGQVFGTVGSMILRLAGGQKSIQIVCLILRLTQLTRMKFPDSST